MNERRAGVFCVAASLAVVWVVIGCNQHIEGMPNGMHAGNGSVGGTGGSGGTGGFAGSAGMGGAGGVAGNGGMSGHDCFAGAGAMMSTGEGGYGDCVAWTADVSCDIGCSECLCQQSNTIPWLRCDAACWSRLQCEQASGCAPDQPECFQNACGGSDSALEATAITRPLLFACTGACPGYSQVATTTPGIDEPMCGSSTCPAFAPNPPGVFAPEHCCTETSACGVSNAGVFHADVCLERDAPGEWNAACPDEQVGMGGLAFSLRGCCRPDQQCGLELQLGGYDMGTGCAERSTLGASFNDFVSSLGTTAWTPIPCK